ncbi:MAG: hypothetical protein ABI053_01040 [Lacisediminihabitans sp.]
MTSVLPNRVLVRPKASLLRNVVSSVVLFSLPLYGALYVLGVSRGSWLVVLGSQCVGIALCALVWARYRAIAVSVSELSIDERGFFFRQSWPLDAVREVILTEIYRPSSAETWHQLLVTDRDNNRLLRMRGVFWREAEMRRVAEAIGVPVTETAEPVTQQAFMAEHPQSVDWYERSRVSSAIVLATALIVAVGIVVGLMALAGVPIGAVA